MGDGEWKRGEGMMLRKCKRWEDGKGEKEGRMTSRGRIHVDVGIIVREGRKRGWEEGRVREEE